jgi:predicted dehydrogenase
MGPPPTTIFEYPMGDDSWEQEWLAFAQDIAEERDPQPGIEAAQAALRVIEGVYSRSGMATE